MKVRFMVPNAGHRTPLFIRTYIRDYLPEAGVRSSELAAMLTVGLAAKFSRLGLPICQEARRTTFCCVDCSV